MVSAAVLLMFAGITCMAGFVTVQRYLLREGLVSEKDMLVVGFALAAGTLFTGIFWWPDIGLTVEDRPVFWSAVFLTTLANIVIQYANNRARAIADSSLTAPVQGMTPMLIMVAAIALQEFPSSVGILGIVLIAVGTWVHNRESATTWREYLMPFRMLWYPTNYNELSAEEQIRVGRDTSALRWSYLSACFGTIGLLFDGIAARNGSVALGFMIELLSLSLVYAVFVQQKPAKVVGDPRARYGLICYGVLFGLHVLFIMTAFRLAPVAYVGSLKRFSILATVLFAWYFLNEWKAGRRLFPAAMIAFGAVALLLDPSSTAIMERADNFLRVLLH